jgi:uncharacterized SAM-binding protein YcdF (DUF218 family)
MFFVLSKILNFLLDPLVWIVIIFLWGLLTRNIHRKRKLLVSSFAMLFFFSNPFIINEVMQAWEIPSVNRRDINKKYEAGIVLGGMIKYYNSEMERANFGSGADRLMQTIDLYNSGKIEKIIITGGSGRLGFQNYKEAEVIRELLDGIQLPAEDILTEGNSRNTYENAVYTAELIKQHNLGGPFLLITSAFHMRRSLAVFEKAGIAVEPYPVDALSGNRTYTPDRLIIPTAEALSTWNIFIREFVGNGVYKVMGYG